MKALRSCAFEVTPEKAIEFTKLSVILTFTWPPKNNQFWFRVFMCTSTSLSLLLIWPLVLSIIEHRNNLLIVIKSVIVIGGILNYVGKVIVVRIYQNELQVTSKLVIGRIFSECKRQREKNFAEIRQQVLEIPVFLNVFFFVMVTAIAAGPALLPQKFPTDAIYPFSVEHPIVAGIVYLHQCLIGYQCFCAMVLDCQAALFIWFISVKFDLLIAETKTVVTRRQFRRYIQKYQNLLRYAEVMIAPTRILTLSTVLATKQGIIISGIFLISNASPAVKIQFGLMALSMIINIYVCIWPADYLLTISSKSLSDEIFGLTWKHDSKTRILWTIVLHQAQKPVAINISGLLNTLSNEYYSALLSAAFSAFATIRATVNA